MPFEEMPQGEAQEPISANPEDVLTRARERLAALKQQKEDSQKEEILQNEEVSKFADEKIARLEEIRTQQASEAPDRQAKINEFQTVIDEMRALGEDTAELEQAVLTLDSDEKTNEARTLMEDPLVNERVQESAYAENTQRIDAINTELDQKKIEMQQPVEQWAFAAKKDILQQKNLWERNTDSSQINEALQPTLDQLKQSGDLLHYLALKQSRERGKMGIGITSLLGQAANEDPETLERSRKEVFTAEQNHDLDIALMNNGNSANLEIAYRAEKVGLSPEKFLSVNPDFLTQLNKNALDFRAKKMEKLSPEDKNILEGQVRAKLDAIKTYANLREKNLKMYEQDKDLGPKLWEMIKSDIDAELSKLKSEGKLLEFLALKGADHNGAKYNLGGIRVPDFTAAILQEDPSEVEKYKGMLTQEQRKSIDEGNARQGDYFREEG